MASYSKITALLAFTFGSALSGAGLADTRAPACLRSWPEARYRNYGYDHIVHVANDCRARAFCAVSTDVNPHPVEVEIPASGQLEILTCRGCAAREFTPRLECRFVS
jgi:hypothetical protein